MLRDELKFWYLAFSPKSNKRIFPSEQATISFSSLISIVVTFFLPIEKISSIKQILELSEQMTYSVQVFVRGTLTWFEIDITSGSRPNSY